MAYKRYKKILVQYSVYVQYSTKQKQTQAAFEYNRVFFVT